MEFEHKLFHVKFILSNGVDKYVRARGVPAKLTAHEVEALKEIAKTYGYAMDLDNDGEDVFDDVYRLSINPRYVYISTIEKVVVEYI